MPFKFRSLIIEINLACIYVQPLWAVEAFKWSGSFWPVSVCAHLSQLQDKDRQIDPRFHVIRKPQFWQNLPNSNGLINVWPVFCTLGPMTPIQEQKGTKGCSVGLRCLMLELSLLPPRNAISGSPWCPFSGQCWLSPKLDSRAAVERPPQSGNFSKWNLFCQCHMDTSARQVFLQKTWSYQFYDARTLPSLIPKFTEPPAGNLTHGPPSPSLFFSLPIFLLAGSWVSEHKQGRCHSLCSPRFLRWIMNKDRMKHINRQNQIINWLSCQKVGLMQKYSLYPQEPKQPESVGWRLRFISFLELWKPLHAIILSIQVLSAAKGTFHKSVFSGSNCTQEGTLGFNPLKFTQPLPGCLKFPWVPPHCITDWTAPQFRHGIRSTGTLSRNEGSPKRAWVFSSLINPTCSAVIQLGCSHSVAKGQTHRWCPEGQKQNIEWSNIQEETHIQKESWKSWQIDHMKLYGQEKSKHAMKAWFMTSLWTGRLNCQLGR